MCRGVFMVKRGTDASSSSSFLDLRRKTSRRSLVRSGFALGLSVPALSMLLASCEDDDEGEGDDLEAAPDVDQESIDPDDDDSDADAPDVEQTPTDEELPSEPAVDPDSAMAYGFNIAWRPDEDGGDFNADTLAALQNSGFNWMRFQVHWSEIQREPEWYDPAPIDRMIDLYDGSDVRVLVSVVGAPEWARDLEGEQLLSDFEQFGAFMTFMADRYRGRVHAWEIWNEQNMAHEMHGEVRVSDYAFLLEAGFQGTRTGDPDALVLFGGLTPTGVNDPAVAIDDVEYLREFYEFEDGYYTAFFDILGAHLNATNNPPDTSYPDNPGPGEWTTHNSFYFLRGLDLREVMDEHGDNRPVWVTEFGWTTENPAPGYEYGSDVSEEDQANYLTRAFGVADEQMPWIRGMFVWNLNFATLAPPDDEKYAWSVLNEDWSPRPAYTALQEMPKHEN
jgi:polysaccharide biosynthesis protein PslG